MRVPDLDWPEDLFDDATVVPTAIVTNVIDAPIHDSTTLWLIMQGAWMRQDMRRTLLGCGRA